MTDYTRSTNFTAKDSLESGNPNKKVKGSEVDTELDAVAGSSSTKANKITPAAVNNVATLSSSGDLQDGGKQLPTGTIVGTTDTQTITNKTVTTSDISSADNTYRVASTTVSGVVEIATQAEVDAGTDTERTVSPATLANSPIPASRLPSLTYSLTTFSLSSGASSTRTAPSGYTFWDLAATSDDDSGQQAGVRITSMNSAGTSVTVRAEAASNGAQVSMVWAKFA
jgi:hypothetical protein